ncbi:hypothetical protein, partial [Chamaesiphon sp. GL140_3_metabinner_50]|uniref:hypothetical protein n=1 Tax=Chamaesiphon sp. GL140_3_metabinner_50 TaxID=2970812 RepID=UPI0025DA99ED
RSRAVSLIPNRNVLPLCHCAHGMFNVLPFKNISVPRLTNYELEVLLADCGATRLVGARSARAILVVTAMVYKLAMQMAIGIKASL